MSYILDALRKSEKERQRVTVPDLMAVQDAIIQEPKKHSLLPYIFFTLLLINTVILMWWLFPLQSKNPGQITSYSTVLQPKSKRIILPSQDLRKTSLPEAKGNRDTSIPEQENIAQERETRFKPIIHQQQQVNVSTHLYKQVPTQIPVIDTESLRKIDPALPQETQTIRRVPPEQPSTNKSVKLGGNEAYNIVELPLSIRQSLLPINISVSLYSDDPSLRMARINGSIIREGEYLTADLKLEKKYIVIENGLYSNNFDDEWTHKVCHSIEEEGKLINAGFELVRAVTETTTIYRKRK